MRWNIEWFLSLLTVVTLGQLVRCEENRCSRSRSRVARSILDKSFQDIMRKEELSPGTECLLKPERNMYWDDERHKWSEIANNWNCLYCGKSFYNEQFLDKHYDNRHGSTVLTGPEAVCLADHCDYLRCDIIASTKKTSFWEEALCKQKDLLVLRKKCQNIMKSCIPSHITDAEKNSLLDKLDDTVCSFLTCEKYWENPYKEDIIFEQLPSAPDFDVEATFIKISLPKKNFLIVGALYRPPSSTQKYMEDLCQSVENLHSQYRNAIIWIGGDLNLPDIDWETQSSSGNQYPMPIKQWFLEMLQNCNLQQMVSFPTRINNCLDLFLSSRPTLLSKCVALPGISDHDILLVESSVVASRNRPVKRKVFLWKHANMENLREDCLAFQQAFTEQFDRSSPVQAMWDNIKTTLLHLMQKHVPSKMTSTRFNQPWISRSLKQLTHRKKRSCDRAKASNSPEDYEKYLAVPDDWKNANVAPVFKKGEGCRPENYRPISLTSIACKVLEHIVHSNIMDHLEDHDILSDAQHGFRKKRSCVSQLTLAIQDLARGIDNWEQLDVILLDFAKVFDKVPHGRLLHKLNFYGIRNCTHAWIADFLRDRMQQVILEGTVSTKTQVTSGVPQGSVIGPISL
eukprot:XP_011683220.1 PREDICTED: uncharacterized protein LOC105447168 [Strongylocentrotus purpuratus]